MYCIITAVTRDLQRTKQLRSDLPMVRYTNEAGSQGSVLRSVDLLARQEVFLKDLYTLIKLYRASFALRSTSFVVRLRSPPSTIRAGGRRG